MESIEQKNVNAQAKYASIPALIPEPEITETKKPEKFAKLEKTIFPSKYISAYECSNNEYVEEFHDNFAPITPRIVTRGVEKLHTDKSSTYKKTKISSPPPILDNTNEETLCIIDFVSLTFCLVESFNNNVAVIDSETKVILLLEQLDKIIPHLHFAPQKKGIFNYKQSVCLTRNKINIGLIGFDGNNGTCFISLSGAGCVGVDMAKLSAFIATLPRSRLTRVDIAHDDLDGVVPVLKYLDKYKNGEFAIKNINPGARFLDDLGSNKGCTLYVGSKKNGKESCIYEKGKQLGDVTSPWVRVEGRISNVDRVIPLDVLTNPAPYLAALYPPFAKLSATHTKISVIKKMEKISMDHLVESASIGYGRLVNYMVMTGYSDAKIVQTLKREGVPKRLQVANSAIINSIPF